MSQKSTILVTGGAGYIGSHLCAYLSEHGHDVVAVDNFSTGSRKNARWGRFYEADLRQPSAVEAVLKSEPGIDAVVHLAALSDITESNAHPLLYEENNVRASRQLIELMLKAGITRIVFASSCTIYGKPSAGPMSETHPVEPVSNYGANKAAVELMLRDDYADALNFAVLRFFVVAGFVPRFGLVRSRNHDRHLVPAIVNAVQRGAPAAVKVFGHDYQTVDGTCVRDFVHVSDVVEAIELALEQLRRRRVCEVFNIGSGTGRTVREVLRVSESIMGVPIIPEAAARRAGDPPTLVADITRAKKYLGWRPCQSEFESIVRSESQTPGEYDG